MYNDYLAILVGQKEFYDEINNRFSYTGGEVLMLKHTLVSISAWESITKKLFFKEDYQMTEEENILYIKCMIINDFPEYLLESITMEEIQKIRDYINDKKSATKVNPIKNQKKVVSREQISSELIYHWMIDLQIPMECQNWHFNRLMNFIKFRNAKAAGPQMMSEKDRIANYQKMKQRNRAKRK